MSLVPSAKGFAEKIRAELGGPVESEGKKLGRKLGDSLEDGVSGGLKGVTTRLAGAFAAVQVGSFLKGAVSAAADTAESVSKLTVLVGDSAEGLDEWSKTTADAFGISRQAALKAAGTFATFFKGIGKSQGEAAAMSKELAELAADMASFSNTSPEQAIEALGAALRGESEPIRAYGVLLDDATLKTRAFNLGLIATTKEALTPAIKVQAAYAEILAQTGDAQGDFARTSDGLAGSQKQLAAQFKDAQASLGEALLPAMSAAVGLAQDLLPAIAGLAETFAGLAGAAGEAVVPVAGVVASLATSDLGAAAITAGAVAFAVAKIGEAAKAAAASLSTMSVANPALLGIGVAVGAAAAVYLSFKKDAAAAKEQQDRLSEAFLDAADPAFLLVDNLTKVVDALKKTKAASGGAAEGVEALADPFKIIEELGPGAVSTLSKVGVGTDEVARALREGRMDELLDRFFESSKKLEGTITSSSGMVRYAGGVEDAALALDRLGKSAEGARRDNAELAKEQLENAVITGFLARGTLDAALASSRAADEQGRWLDAAEDLTPELEDMAAKAGIAAGGMDDLGGAAAGSVGGQEDAAGSASDLAEAQDLAKDAAKKHEDALKDLSQGIDDFISLAFDGQKAADDWASSLKDLAEQLTGQQLDLNIANTGADVDLKGIDRAIKAETDAEVERLRDQKKAQSDASAAETERLRDEKAAVNRANDAEIARLRAVDASADQIAAATAARAAADDAYDQLIEAASDRSGVDGGFDEAIEAAADAGTARMAAVRAELGIASEENQEAFEGFVDDARDQVQDLIDRGGTAAEVADLTARLVEGLRGNAAGLGIVLKDNIVSLDGNSAAALANRDAFRGLVNAAKADVQRLIDQGAPIEEVTTKANDLAAEVVAVGSTMGLSGPELDGYVAGIRGIGETAAEANRQLQALPTQLSVDIEATMRLDLDQFREGLLIAASEFQDEMSRATVASGILEIDGASFALPKRAAGGPVTAGQAYWVGEHGPELLVPDINGMVIANHELALVGASAGGGAPLVGAINVTEAADAGAVVDEVNARLGWMLTTRNER